MNLIDKKQKQSDSISDAVAEFLAKGGEVTTYDPCSVQESMWRSKKPYAKRGKDGRRYISRNYTVNSVNRIHADAYRGHNTK